MIHKHTFFKVGEVTKPIPGALGVHRGTPGIDVTCVDCGQVRKLWADGVVEITVEGGKPIEEDSA